MSNKSISNQGDASVSDQTNLNNQRNSEGDFIEISLVIFSLIASIYLFFLNSFLTTQEDLLNYAYALNENDIADLVVLQFNDYCIARFGINVNGFVLGSLLILIGILGIITILNSESRGSSLAINTAIFQLPTGVLLIISSSFSKAGANRLIEMATTPMYAMSAFKIAYWLEFICYILFLTSVIMLAISAGRNKYKNLKTALIIISVGFFIINIATIFSIITVNKYINSHYADISISYIPGELVGSLITALTLTALAKIMLVISFLFGLISFQRKTNKQFVIFFSFTTAIFCILKVINTATSIIYSFSVYPDIDILDKYTIYLKRLINTNGIYKTNIAFYWIIFIAGVFGVLKLLVFDEMSAYVVQRTTNEPVKSVQEELQTDDERSTPQKQKAVTAKKPTSQQQKAVTAKKSTPQQQKAVTAKKSTPQQQKAVTAKKSTPQQQKAVTEERICTVCGIIAEDDCIVCATCGAYIPKE